MENNVEFTSLEKLKRRAKRIGKATDMPHSEALETAAREGGFRSFYEARKHFEKLEL